MTVLAWLGLWVATSLGIGAVLVLAAVVHELRGLHVQIRHVAAFFQAATLPSEDDAVTEIRDLPEAGS